MIREKDLEFSSGMMGDDTKGTGKMGSRTARAPISHQMEEYGKESRWVSRGRREEWGCRV